VLSSESELKISGDFGACMISMTFNSEEQIASAESLVIFLPASTMISPARLLVPG